MAKNKGNGAKKEDSASDISLQDRVRTWADSMWEKNGGEYGAVLDDITALCSWADGARAVDGEIKLVGDILNYRVAEGKPIVVSIGVKSTEENLMALARIDKFAVNVRGNKAQPGATSKENPNQMNIDDIKQEAPAGEETSDDEKELVGAES